MSTTFGVRISHLKTTIEVAHRHGISNHQVQIDILNPLIYLLPTDTKVIPLDNSSQGIHTVNDILNCTTFK